MDSRVAVLCLTLLVAMLMTCAECRKKKVVIHVPYKVKKIKHTHTVFKTLFHGSGHHHGRPSHDHIGSPSEDHEHFHHMLEDPSPVGSHSQPIGGISIPDFLPDVPMDVPDIPDVPRDLVLNRLIPHYRRT